MRETKHCLWDFHLPLCNKWGQFKGKETKVLGRSTKLPQISQLDGGRAGVLSRPALFQKLPDLPPHQSASLRA